MKTKVTIKVYYNLKRVLHGKYYSKGYIKVNFYDRKLKPTYRQLLNIRELLEFYIILR